MSTKTDKVTCPTCTKPNTWRPDNAFRPFCSERCRLIDLGEWAAETHRIPAEPAQPEDLDTPDNEG